MVKLLSDKFALSGQGSKDMIKAILAVVAQNIALMFPVSLLYMFTGDFVNGADLRGNALIYAAGIVLCLGFIYFTSVLQYNTSFRATYKESALMRISLAEKLRKLPLSFFAKKDLSDLTGTIMSDVETMEHSCSHMIPQFFGSIISTFIICAGLFFFNWKMAIAAVWPVPAALIIVITSKGVQNHFTRKQTKAKLELNDGVQEFIEVSRDLKCNNAEEAYLKELEEKVDMVEKRAIGSELGTALFVVSAQMLLKFGIGTVALAGGVLLTAGELNLMQFFCFLLVASRLYEPMSGTLINLAAINSLQINVDRMNVINETPAQEGLLKFNPKGYDIEFKHAGFSYEEDKSVLSDVSFTARQGEVTALVGPSGGGKTTVSRLAARFWDYDRGEVKIGGVDVKDVDPEALLSAFSIVFQDVTLFNNTVMENIRVGKKDATDEEVLRAAKLANCDEFVRKLPKGYDTVIGENGSELSGGERQRISIARAFLKDAPIILLDEATASLDAENESRVQGALSRLIKDKTVMVIAHRMRTVAGANKVVVLDGGKVAEQGTPEELLKSRGIFSRMASLQTAGQNWSIAG